MSDPIWTDAHSKAMTDIRDIGARYFDAFVFSGLVRDDELKKSVTEHQYCGCKLSAIGLTSRHHYKLIQNEDEDDDET